VPLLHALVLGIAQGLTEFLPVSSTAHLELIPWFFGWDDFGDDAALENAFDVALHLGTTVGVVAYLWGDVVHYTAESVLAPLRGRGLSRDGRIGWFLLLSAVPAAVIALALEDVLLDLAEEIWLIGVMLIVLGLVLAVADRLAGPRVLTEFGWRDALLMGGGQALALIPGVSRSGGSMTAGRLIGFERESVARIAFLMSIPIIAGAAVVRGLQVLAGDGIPGELVGGFVVGVAASALTGWFAVWFMLRWLRTRSFVPFVIYRCALGGLVLVLLATGVR
jgi:undecaprenyl-diphosphatase